MLSTPPARQDDHADKTPKISTLIIKSAKFILQIKSIIFIYFIQYKKGTGMKRNYFNFQ